MTDPLDDLFHFCALRAYLQVARKQQGWPESESVRKLATELYEVELKKERNNIK